MSKNRFTAAECKYHLDRAIRQAKRDRARGYDTEMVDAAVREWRRRMVIALEMGYWEHEYDPIPEPQTQKETR